MPAYDRKAMQNQILSRTQNSYDRKEGDASSKYFRTDIPFKMWRVTPTKTSPHIIDIVPFIAGNKCPTKFGNMRPGEWAYVLDLYCHQNVGPGKAMVVCPARNYGEPCCICEDVDILIQQGIEWNDIPHAPKRRCVYNVLVMDTAETEALGIQIWEVSFEYSEKAIVGLAKSPRGGGLVAFADPSKELGRSIVFDVGSDTYKKITGHRFEMREYDIPDEILEMAIPLDELIVVHDNEELKKMMWGSAGRPTQPQEAAVKEVIQQPSSLRSTLRSRGTNVIANNEGESATPAVATPEPQKLPTELACEFGAEFGSDYGKYGECDTCEKAQKCAEAADRKDAGKTKPRLTAKQAAEESVAVQEEVPPAATSTGRRTLLRRGQ